MSRWSEDVLDNHPIYLDQYPGALLDFLGVSCPSPEELLIQSETLRELITMAKNTNTRINNADIEAAAELAALAEQAETEHTESTEDVTGADYYGPVKMALTGTMMTILIHDEALKLDTYGLPGLIQAQADRCQYMRVSNARRIDKMQAQAKERLDPTSAATNRPKVESNGDFIDDVIDGELEGLTARQALFMADMESQIENAELMLADFEVWWAAISPDDRPLLRRTDSEVLARIIETEEKRHQDALALVEKRKHLASVKMDRLLRMNRASVQV